jgi:hypothetical protein
MHTYVQETHAKMVEALAKMANDDQRILSGGGVRELMKGSCPIAQDHKMSLETWKRSLR